MVKDQFDRSPFDDTDRFSSIEDMIKEMMGARPSSYSSSRDRRSQDRGKDGPKFDVVEYEDETHVVFEIPGAEENDVDFEVSEGEVRVVARTEKGSYTEKTKIPRSVKSDEAELTYSNRVFDITVPKRV